MNIWLYDFLNTLFPLNCQVCGKLLTRPEPVICIACENRLPRTLFTADPDNPVSRIFWGRTQIQQATSLMKFDKGSDFRVLLHNLKYRGYKGNGTYLGKLLGLELAGTVFASCDAIVPVPLHPGKLRKRGYNQAGIIAGGVASILNKPVWDNLLLRASNTDTQTRKNRYERFLNMESGFILNPNARISGSLTLLLIDDVVTTGATLEACSEAILKKIQASIYAATVAYA
ncbi:MAG: ComF family protein [Bacteroidales bacterium]|nr:ComF family protein [Bacteroidales bacterium]MBN2699184.1 ComF family protein [Bacteroidales bacterium]